MRSYAASGDASELVLGVVVARFNHLVSVRLLEGCVSELERRGCNERDIHVAWVPGAFEIPQAAQTLAASGRYDAIVTLGAVIRGGTPHFDFVCQGVTDGVREVIRDTGAICIKDVGRCMKTLRNRYAGRMDFGKAGGMVRGTLA